MNKQRPDIANVARVDPDDTRVTFGRADEETKDAVL